jgi:hypothetical protein
MSTTMPAREPPSSLAATILSPLREAVVTMLAALATLACAMAIDPEVSPAVLAVVLCLSFSRSHLDHNLRGRLEAAVALPVIGLVAAGVGTLLHRMPWAGAIVFVAGMFVSIWLRRFGPMTRRAGAMIALPFVAILTTPYVPTKHASHLMSLIIPVLVALLALLWVTALQTFARRVHWLPPVKPMQAVAIAPPRTSTQRPTATTRLAIQMAVALGVAFVVGYVFFAERWAWIVLTAFIVNSGNRGRLDVAYKSVLRVLGAAAGTIAALAFSLHAGAHDAATIALILAAVFLGIWLRPLGYAWWALFVTVALALLQGFDGSAAQHILWLRLEEIVIGALIGIGAAWFVLPVRSTDVLRRRIADALAILSDAVDPATPARQSGDFIAAIAHAQQLAPAFRASRLTTRHFRALQPADWIDALVACRESAAALIDQGETPGIVRKAVGIARKAMREPTELLSALQQLRHSLEGNSRDESFTPPDAGSGQHDQYVR